MALQLRMRLFIKFNRKKLLEWEKERKFVASFEVMDILGCDGWVTKEVHLLFTFN
jgi:hypothetical protein